MTSLVLRRIEDSTAGVLPRRTTSIDEPMSLNDPAVRAMNDFAREYPVTEDEDRQVDDALGDMVRLGVRALLVVHERRVTGLITSYDIEGERPMQCMQRLNYAYRRDIQVSHVMTPWSELLTLNWRNVRQATAAELLAVFRESGIMHLLVVETPPGGPPCVRGLFSRTRLERQLGLAQAPPAAAGSAATG